MRRITVGGSEVAALLQADGIEAPAAWLKVFLPSGEGRAYTISGIDHQARTLDLDFVLHGVDATSGPASAWASQAHAGERIGIAGPRSGGFALPEDACWTMLAGDATALPAIQAIARSLPAGLKAKVYVEMPQAVDQQAIASAASLRVQWLTVRAAPGMALHQHLMYRPLPPGPGYLWIAGESAAVRALRMHYLQERQFERHRVSAKGYWKAGEADHRDA
ncbi:siderophore-interacting protein [Acidovorax bellezanensis]|nr:siderophore-interacting protein [Acidovorax sp. Be4]